MTKKLVVAGIIVVACLWVAKKTQFISYAGTMIAQGKANLHRQIPIDLQLARVRNEIKQLDKDYQALLGPIAEKKVAVKNLETEVVTGKDNLAARREALVALTKSIQDKETLISYQGSNYNLDQARVKLAQDFTDFKKKEIHLATKEKLLNAERTNLTATFDQLDKLVSQKREFEIKLAELEAEVEMLRARSTTCPLPTDDGRVADIANSLKEIEQALKVQTTTIELQQHYGTKIGDAQPSVQPVTDLNTVLDHLQGKAATPGAKVAQGQK